MTRASAHPLNRTARLAAAALAIFAGAALPAFAHHSFAMYDMNKVVTAQAEIKEFRWGAPHSSGVFVIKGQSMTLQGAAPSMFVQQGFKKEDVRRGQKITLSWHPMRNGAAGGAIASIKLADGRTFKDQEYVDQAR